MQKERANEQIMKAEEKVGHNCGTAMIVIGVWMRGLYIDNINK